MTKMRKVKSRKEITDSLCKIFLKENSFIIWQNQEKFRPIINCNIEDIDSVVNILEVTNQSAKDDLSLIDPDLPLYLKAEEKELLFKIDARKFFFKDNSLSIDIPREVRMIELREVPRFEIPNDSRLTTEVLKPTNRPGKNNHFNLSILDISTNGMAFKLSYKNASQFNVGEVVYLDFIGQKKLSNKLPCTIIYKKKKTKIIKGKPETYIQVGLKFKNALTQSFIEKFL